MSSVLFKVCAYQLQWRTGTPREKKTAHHVLARDSEKLEQTAIDVVRKWYRERDLDVPALFVISGRAANNIWVMAGPETKASKFWLTIGGESSGIFAR